MADYELPTRLVRHKPDGAKMRINDADFNDAIHEDWTDANAYVTDLDVEAYTSNPPQEAPSSEALDVAEQVLETHAVIEADPPATKPRRKATKAR